MAPALVPVDLRRRMKHIRLWLAERCWDLSELFLGLGYRLSPTFESEERTE